MAKWVECVLIKAMQTTKENWFRLYEVDTGIGIEVETGH